MGGKPGGFHVDRIIEVDVVDDGTEAEEEALVQAAIEKDADSIIGEAFGEFFD